MLLLLKEQFRKSVLLQNTTLTRFRGAIILALVISLFFSLMARIDFFINATLYDYGLIFSYDWAIPYWNSYYATFVVFSFILSFIYWFGSRKADHDKKVSIALFATINLLAIGGLQDVLYFTFWAGGLPPNNVVWWWSQWIGVFRTWNSLMQVAFTVTTIGISISIWALILQQKKKPAITHCSMLTKSI